MVLGTITSFSRILRLVVLLIGRLRIYQLFDHQHSAFS